MARVAVFDKQILKQFNLINFLLPGDVVIADIGFTFDDHENYSIHKRHEIVGEG